MIAFLLILIHMPIQNPQDLIGKHISILPNYERRENAETNQKTGIRSFYSETDLVFLDEKINSLYIKTDEDNIVIQVKFFAYKMLETPHYLDLFNKEFGKPNACFCFDELKKASEYHSAEGVVVGSKIFSTKKCDCNADDVIYSVWKLKESLYLELTHPFMENTFPRLGVKFSQTNDLLETD